MFLGLRRFLLTAAIVPIPFCFGARVFFDPELAYITEMARKSQPKPDDLEQSKRFIKTAEEVGADDDKALERALKKIAPSKAKPVTRSTS